MSFSTELDKLVVIEAPTHGKDAAGGNTTVYTDFDEVWAGFRNLSGAEKQTSSHGGQAPVARTEITIRFHPDIDERMRIRYEGKRYNIRHINDWNSQGWKMILTCDTGAAVTG